MRRVLIIGCSGAGKSTLARKLCVALGLPLIGLDRVYWRAGWIEPSPAEWRQAVSQLVAEPAWVMDGNYAATFDLRMPRADTLVWLDFPRMTCLRRVIFRALMGYGRTRPDLPEGCPEKIDLTFWRWVWDFPTRSRPGIPTAIERHGAHLRVVRLDNNRAVAAFLRAPEAA
jgi:adenylate kinase family enzyme